MTVHREFLATLDALVPPSVRVVGLGEPTHGQSTVNTYRFEISRWLIAERSARVLAFEAPARGMQRADAWVKGGADDVHRVVGDLEYWMYRTTEMIELLTWVRQFNMRRPPSEQVSVAGVDVDDPSRMSWSARDASMAAELRRWSDQEGLCAWWAHIGHVGKSANWIWDPTQSPAGRVLAESLGKKYVAIGALYGAGDFTAAIAGPDGRRSLEAIVTGEPPDGTYERLLNARMSGGPHLISTEDDVFSQARGFRSCGAEAEKDDDFVAFGDVRACFDAVLWVPIAEALRVICVD